MKTWCADVSDLHLLQGEESVVTRLAPPPAMLENPQAQTPPRNFNESTEGDGDPKTGNTCNALSGRVEQNSIHVSSRPVQWCPPSVPCKNTLTLSTCLLLPQVHSPACPTSLVSGGRVGGAVSTRKFPAAAWPPPLPSTRRCTAWANSNATSWTHAWTCSRSSSTGVNGGECWCACSCFVCIERLKKYSAEVPAKALPSSDSLRWFLSPGCLWRKPVLQIFHPLDGASLSGLVEITGCVSLRWRIALRLAAPPAACSQF